MVEVDELIIGEVEMFEDDFIEELFLEINVFDVMIEVLVLVLFDFFRKEGVELGEVVFIEFGKDVMIDEFVCFFVGLVGLKEVFENKDKDC